MERQPKQEKIPGLMKKVEEGFAMMAQGIIHASEWVWDQFVKTFSMQEILQRRVANCPFVEESVRKHQKL